MSFHWTLEMGMALKIRLLLSAAAYQMSDNLPLYACHSFSFHVWCTRLFLCSEEEVSFGRTLDKGIARLKKAAAAAKSADKKHIDSKDAFEMWDTYGFPVDLTQVSPYSRYPS